MNFAEQLKAKKDLKVIEFANEFSEIIKPTLVKSAEKGYSAYRYAIDTNLPDVKDKLQLYSNPLFVEQLNKNLDGVEAKYEKEFRENILLRGFGWYDHYLTFKW